MKDHHQDWEIQICRDAVKQWGFEAQVHVAVEEMAELIKALMKYLQQRGVDPFLDVVEEIADVEIMLLQLSMFFDPHRIERIKKEKLERLEKRLRPEA